MEIADSEGAADQNDKTKSVNAMLIKNFKKFAKMLLFLKYLIKLIIAE